VGGRAGARARAPANARWCASRPGSCTSTICLRGLAPIWRANAASSVSNRGILTEVARWETVRERGGMHKANRPDDQRADPARLCGPRHRSPRRDPAHDHG
jgi:hypothetical protein